MSRLDFFREHLFGDFDKGRLFNGLKIIELSRGELKLFLMAFVLVNCLMMGLGFVMGFSYANTRCMVFYTNNRIAENCFVERSLEEQKYFTLTPAANTTGIWFHGPGNFTFLVSNLTLRNRTD